MKRPQFLKEEASNVSQGRWILYVRSTLSIVHAALKTLYFMQISNRKQTLLKALLGQKPYAQEFSDLKPVFCSKSYRGDAEGFKVYNFCYFEKHLKFKFFTKVLLLDPLNIVTCVQSFRVHSKKMNDLFRVN